MKKEVEKKFYIMAFISVLDEAYIFKTADRNLRRIYRNHASGGSIHTLYMFDQSEPPRFFLLEENGSPISSVKAHGQSIAWSKFLNENGYILADEGIRKAIQSLRPYDEHYYKKLLNNINLKAVIDPSNDLSLKFKSIPIEKRRISVELTKKEYNEIALRAFSSNLKIKEYCECLLKDNVPLHTDIREVNNCISNINSTLNFLENVIRRSDQNVAEDAGLPELLMLLRAEMKTLRVTILNTKEKNQHDM